MLHLLNKYQKYPQFSQSEFRKCFFRRFRDSNEVMQIVMNGVRAEKRKCVVCGAEFMGKGRQKTCGHLCSDSPKMLKRKSRKKLSTFLKKQEY